MTIKSPFLATQSWMALLLSISPALGVSLPPPLAYWLYGSEQQETIVLIHGFNSTHRTWDKIIPVLSKRYRVLIYDQPGHGLSKSEGRDFSPSKMAEELNGLLEFLGIKQAHIVGHSMGGRTAMAFATRYPQRVKSVLVEDMSALSVPESVAALPKELERFDRVKNEVPDVFSNLTAATLSLSWYYTPEEVFWILASAETFADGRIKLGNRPEVTALYLHQGLALDMSNELRSIKAPLKFFAADPQSGTAVLQGTAIAHIRRVRPDVSIQVFPQASHSIHKHPEFSDALMRFLGQEESIPHKNNPAHLAFD